MDVKKELAALRTEPVRPGAEDIEAMENRVKALQMLYEATGRDNPAHSDHGLLTGLWEAAQKDAPF